MATKTLTLHNGAEFEGSCSYADGMLFCTLLNVEHDTDAGVFLDANATSVITYQYGEQQDTYKNFTFLSLTKTEVGFSVSLKGGIK